MTVTPVQRTPLQPEIRWEPLPADFQLPDDPVDNLGQPLLAGALRESLELANWIRPEMLVVSNFGLCATIDGQIVAKAPDWLYVASVQPWTGDGERRSYTPHAEGEVPTLVMEFLSETDGGEYSVKRTFPPGKWYFYEQILQVPYYVIFDPSGGLLEFYQLQNGRYILQMPDENGWHWIGEMQLFLGTWRGTKDERTGYWLRWWNDRGEILAWAVERIGELEAVAEQERERAEQERERAEQERERAEQERQEKERLLAYLRSQGIDPDRINLGNG
ncbi:MAG: Uma2 family endonuclease [Geitlerinemataceae cyanobacterium]